MDLTAVIGLLIAGAACGFPIGRWWAEVARAKYDMQRTWENRDHYRRNR